MQTNRRNDREFQIYSFLDDETIYYRIMNYLNWEKLSLDF